MNRLLLLLTFLWSFKPFAQTSDFKSIDFEKADSIAKQLKGASLNDMPILVHRLTSNLSTDVEKFRAVYTWVCLNIENDYGNHLQNLKKRRKFQNDSTALANWNTEFKKRALKKLIKHKKTICTGYAYLLQELASFAGLNCKMVHGYGRTVSANVGELSIPNHSWNVIRLNGKWYLSDPTWSSGFFHFDDGRFVAQYNDGYFLADPELFVKSHYPLDTRWILMETDAPTIDDFLTGPLVYGNTFKYSIMPLQPVSMKAEIPVNKEVAFKFRVPKDHEKSKFRLVMNRGSSDIIIKPESYNEQTEILEFRYVFKRGLYDVHLKVNDDVVTTYTVKGVKKQVK
ncbi:transglutaminase domain-containing protein [Seonamhaeicola sp.]|uniref:transglutaminase domain-containing protein n=1 Tax=Seonamhaeicola sp. TaxID=1912245 RepID=UPI0026101DB2|nr:transglutaminase domain-containing protein [Seonamhaeicola sp.]